MEHDKTKKSIKSVQVLLSAYNGETYIEEQIRSIFNQKEVQITCITRDDGSEDKTVKILKKLSKEYELQVICEKNIGWKKSFHRLIELSEDKEYYAFSDQDDVWLDHKLERAVRKLEDINNDIPALYYSDAYITDEKLDIIGVKKNLSPPMNKETALTIAYGQGCTMVFNHAAKKLYKKYKLKRDVSHECWMAILCIYFGRVIHDDYCSMFYRQHSINVSGAAPKSTFILFKDQLNNLWKKGVYIAYYEELYQGYGQMLNERDRKIILNFVNYKRSFPAKMHLLVNPNVKRYTLMGTIFLKISILLSRFGETE